MDEDALISIIGDKYRALVLRLVVTHKTKVFEESEVARILNVRGAGLKSALQALLREGIITKKRATKTTGTRTSTVSGFIINREYPFLPILNTLILNTIPNEKRSLFRALTKMRGMKVVIATGSFTRNKNTDIDVLLAGDGVSEKNLVTMLKKIEREFGVELRYVLYSSNDFMHFLTLRDKRLRNIFDYPHNIYLNALEKNNE